MFARCLLLSFQRGDPLYRHSDAPGGLYGIAEGAVSITVSLDDQDPFIGDLLQPGSWVGEAAILTDAPRRVGVTATRPTTALLLPKADFAIIATRIPEAAQWLGVLAVSHMDRAMQIATDLMLRDPHSRAAAVLLRLAGLRAGKHTFPVPREIDMNHEQLAHIANLSRTTLGAFLRELEARGTISQSYRRITILDADALADHL